MKYLFATIISAVLFACNQPAKNTVGSAPPALHIVSYVNNIALKTPGWDNNDATRAEMQQTLSKSFASDIQDSNLLAGVYFTLDEIKKVKNDSFAVIFKAANLSQQSSLTDPDDYTDITLRIYSFLPDSLAKPIKERHFYYITSYTKDVRVTNFVPGLFPPISHPSHTVRSCFLGSHYIEIQKIEAVNPSY